VLDYQKKTVTKSDVERQAATEKTGIFTGGFALNPINGQEIPIWVSDYVLMDYGTGAIMAVPGHDERDFEFAQKFNLPILRVIEGGDLPYTGDGMCVNSSLMNGLTKEAAIQKITIYFEEKKIGERKINYKFRDWLFSRQRYWGEPFPIVHYPQAGRVALEVKDLPVVLPKLADFQPTETGDAPLAKASDDWLKMKNPLTGEIGRRETDTMPGSAGSSWYFLRYTDPKNPEALCSFEAQKYFMPVDLYIGGAEHTVGHLMYARFWQKILYDEGLVSHEEPFKKLIHQGMILGEDGEKMSKSRGNTISPDDVVAHYGADALRTYEMFMGPLERDKPWSQNGLVGVFKFLAKVWRLFHDDREERLIIDDSKASEDVQRLLHQTIKKVTHDIEKMAFNTAVSLLMIFVNEVGRQETRPHSVMRPFLQLLAPFAPHIAEEIWHKMGETGFISIAPWPQYDEGLTKSDSVTVAVQINGKVRAKVEVEVDLEEKQVVDEIKKLPNIQKIISETTQIKKIIFVKNRIINIII
jgi:leucyl-tRNA synthetase